MIAVGGAVNVRGTRHSANVQNWSTGIKVAAILGMSILLLGSGSGLVGVRAATFAAPVEVSLVSGIGVAMIGVLWAYEGWANVAASAGETLEPQRSFPRGIGVLSAGRGQRLRAATASARRAPLVSCPRLPMDAAALRGLRRCHRHQYDRGTAGALAARARHPRARPARLLRLAAGQRSDS